MKYILVVIFMLAISTLALLYLENNTDPFSSYRKQITLPRVYVKDQPFDVEVVATVEERRAGLAGRESFPLTQGMLFVPQGVDYHGIWMKDMKFPIDIIWIDEHFYVIDIRRSVDPKSYPYIFKPTKKSRYVLEINAGLSDIYGIEVGDRVRFSQVLRN